MECALSASSFYAAASAEGAVSNFESNHMAPRYIGIPAPRIRLCIFFISFWHLQNTLFKKRNIHLCSKERTTCIRKKCK